MCPRHRFLASRPPRTLHRSLSRTRTDFRGSFSRTFIRLFFHLFFWDIIPISYSVNTYIAVRAALSLSLSEVLTRSGSLQRHAERSPSNLPSEFSKRCPFPSRRRILPRLKFYHISTHVCREDEAAECRVHLEIRPRMTLRRSL